jgi:hypothetical protein
VNHVCLSESATPSLISHDKASQHSCYENAQHFAISARVQRKPLETPNLSGSCHISRKHCAFLSLHAEHTSHERYLYLEPQARHLLPLLLLHSLIYTIMLSSSIYHQSPSIVQTLRLHESSPICFVLTNLSLPNTIVALPPSACVAVTLTQPHPTPTSYRASIHASIVH